MKQKRTLYIRQLCCIAVALIFAMQGCTNDDYDKTELENFNLRAPVNNSIDLLTQVTLKWNGISPDTILLPYSNFALTIIPEYEVYLWEKETNELILHRIVTDKEFLVENLKGKTTYQWKVIVGGNNQVLKESETWEFTTEPKTYRESICLRTQAEVDAFGENEYERVLGKIEIVSSGDDPIVDLSPLSTIVSISDNLRIFGNNQLTSINGFENLEFIGGYLIISQNNALTVLDGFESLTTVRQAFQISDNDGMIGIETFNNLNSVGGSFSVNYNDVLTAIGGFENLTSVGETSAYIAKEFEILLNNKLTSISGFNNLETTGSDMGIMWNSELTVIDGFKNLTSVGGELSVSGNPKLISLSDLNNLETVGGSLVIYNNPVLTSITGFNSLFYVSYSDGLWIQSNSAFSSFCCLKHLIVTGNYQGSYNVNGNLTNPTIDEIKAMVCN